jgi:hypothetical protein
MLLLLSLKTLHDKYPQIMEGRSQRQKGQAHERKDNNPPSSSSINSSLTDPAADDDAPDISATALLLNKTFTILLESGVLDLRSFVYIHIVTRKKYNW